MPPFTLQESRAKFPDTKTFEDNLREAGINGQVGDRCFLFYRGIIRTWRESPRWTTAHNLYKKVRAEVKTMTDEDDIAAYELAWQVFFNLYVMPYEVKKREENGEVE